MEAVDVLLSELTRRHLHGFTDPGDEVLGRYIFVFLGREAINVYHGKTECLGIGRVLEPNVRITITEQTHEGVTEFDSVSWQVHVAMVETKELFGNNTVILSYITLLDAHLDERSGVHIECFDPGLDLVHLYVLPAVVDADRVQIITNYAQSFALHRALDGERPQPTKHIAQHLAVLEVVLDHAVPLSRQLGAPVDAGHVDFEANLVFHVHRLIVILLASDTLQVVEAEL